MLVLVRADLKGGSCWVEAAASDVADLGPGGEMGMKSACLQPVLLHGWGLVPRG